jgi:ferritin-like metal-binding protein YciE
MATTTNSNGIQSAVNPIPPVEFIHALKEAYGIEKQHIRILGDMLMAVNSRELKDLIENHLDITELQEKRIEEVFRLMNVSPSSVRNDSMESLVKLAEGALSSPAEASEKDASILNIAQKIEQFEIEFYRSLCVMSKITANADIIEMLQATFDEEEFGRAEMAAFSKQVLVNV